MLQPIAGLQLIIHREELILLLLHGHLNLMAIHTVAHGIVMIIHSSIYQTAMLLDQLKQYCNHRHSALWDTLTAI